MVRFVVVASGKGGVGKTTTALNLGNALVSYGANVIVVDCDLANPNISLHLGSDKVKHTLNDLLNGTKKIHNVIYDHASGMKVIPASIALSDLQHAHYNRLQNAFSGLKGLADIVIVDSHPGVNSDAQHLFALADEVLIITTPELSAVTDAMKTIRVAEAMGTTVIGVVLNRVEGKSYEMEQMEIESLLGKPIIAKVPEDINVKRATNDNLPVFHAYPKSGASREFSRLAASLSGYEEARQGGFFRDLLRVFGL